MEDALKLDNYSYEDYLAIDKTTKERIELIFGKIYLMAGASAQHQDVVGNIFFILKKLASKESKCLPRVAPFDFKLKSGNNISVVQPDIILFCDEESQPPCAIFEVLSPSTALKDKTVKKDLYKLNGIKEYYLINVDYALVDKFELINGEYIYVKAYGIEENIKSNCIDGDILVSDIFDGIELPKY